MANSEELYQSGVLQKAVDFFLKYGYYDVSKDLIRAFIEEHLKYNTLELIWDKDEIVALTRWNVNGKDATILDCIIHPDFRGKDLMRTMLVSGWKKFPDVQTMQFERGLKNKATRRFNVNKILRTI